MALLNKTYSQSISSKGKQITRPDAWHFIRRLWFRSNRKRIFMPSEGFSSWYINAYLGTFGTGAYTVCPFDTQEFISEKINIYKRKTASRFYVGKSGLYEINTKWFVSLSDSFTTQCQGISLYLSKNGITDTNDLLNFIHLDYRNMWTNCIGPGGCYDYFDAAVLHGSKTLWLNKDSDYAQVMLTHSSAIDIETSDSHSGYIEITYKGKEARAA